MAHDIKPLHHYSIITLQIALHCICPNEAADGLNEIIGQEIGEGFVADYSFCNVANPTIVRVHINIQPDHLITLKPDIAGY